MAGEIKLNSVNFASESGGTITLNNVDSETNRTNLGMGGFTGMIASFAMSSAPTGWLVCNGAPYAIADYGDLYTAIGTTWGALTDENGGAGSTHFRVPDLRGAFLRGTGSHGSSTMAKGSAFAGPSVGSFEDDQMQDHAHTVYPVSNSGAALNSGGDINTYGAATLTSSSPVQANSQGTPRAGDETRPFNAGINYCIKY